MLNKLDIPKNLHGQIGELPIRVLSNSIDLYEEVLRDETSALQFRPVKEYLSLKRDQFETNQVERQQVSGE